MKVTSQMCSPTCVTPTPLHPQPSNEFALGAELSFDVNLHYLFPQTNTPKFTPYVLGGIGYLRASASATVAGSTIDASASDTGLNIGGGARWQVGSRWGLKPEIKVLIADNSSVRFALGIYRR